MEARLRQALLRAEEVDRALADPGVGKDPDKAEITRPGAHPARSRGPTRRAARTATG